MFSPDFLYPSKHWHVSGAIQVPLTQGLLQIGWHVSFANVYPWLHKHISGAIQVPFPHGLEQLGRQLYWFLRSNT